MVHLRVSSSLKYSYYHILGFKQALKLLDELKKRFLSLKNITLAMFTSPIDVQISSADFDSKLFVTDFVGFVR